MHQRPGYDDMHAARGADVGRVTAIELVDRVDPDPGSVHDRPRSHVDPPAIVGIDREPDDLASVVLEQGHDPNVVGDDGTMIERCGAGDGQRES